jgi:glycosyltransferase involved in cell wall biosynthesis
MMVGDGPEKENAELLCQQLGIEDKVIFFGNSNEVDQILHYSDLFVLPSETESFGLAALEAMASGVPVVSSNAGGLPELNRHGVSGLMSNVGDVEEMAKQVYYLVEKEERLMKFKDQAKERANAFSLEAVLPLYEKLYDKVLNS